MPAAQITAADALVKRVILFGSLLKEVPGNPRFDIDLAVDLVDLLRLPAHVRKRIEETGIVLFVRDHSNP